MRLKLKCQNLDYENKNYYKLLLDTYISIPKYGIGLTDYLNYEFYKKTKEERKE